MARKSAKKIDPRRQAEIVLPALVKLYPTVKCGLDFQDAYQLLVATILSAQCTDARVNMVTPSLFSRYPDATALAKADQKELETIVHSIGLFRAKVKNLIAMAGTLVELHAGEVPAEMAALTHLPGVGRKTANVVLGNVFGIASGVVVDTHVKRLCFRLGLTSKTDPVQIESELVKILPQEAWVDFSHRLIDHGRKVCVAQRPKCTSCNILDICPRVGLTPISAGESTK